ncbi:BamA/TamA family outer membrane protein [Povalibacter sp.]|uniref:BamA/TamA family outer membrane protein n=1 Tax=Povalibacter sp. TaxID=1962978 RepID=UPI002F41859E
MKRVNTAIAHGVCLAMLLALGPVAAAEDIAQLALITPQAGPSANRALDSGQLLRRRAKIGRVDILVDDVFEKGTSLAAPYRLANTLHISTKTQTIANQLLFHSGDAYDPHSLEESARMLRDQRYLNEASIEPVRYNDDNTVDVLVRVHDVWTMSPGFSFGRKGGANSINLEFEDTNFLGWGKQIAVDRSSTVDRDIWRIAYKDPQVFGSWWRLGASHADMSDGHESTLSLGRPFYSLDSRWSFNVAAVDSTATQSQYSLGEIVNQFQMQQSSFDVGGGWSQGLREGWTRRYLGGLRYIDRAFAPPIDGGTADLVSNAIPQGRVLAYPWAGVEVIEDQYRKTRNLDQIGRTEDLYLGRTARLELGYASTAFGSTQSALMINASAQAGFEPADEQYIIGNIGLHGRVERGELRNTLLDIGSRYYLRQSLRSVLFASATFSLASQLDPEEQLLLGGDNGLRGYPLRYQAGTSRALFTIEERFYTNWQPLKLFNVGAAVFFDAGRTWGTDPYAAANGSGESLGWLRDVGVGLRLGSARSGLGNVLHIDVAMPLDGGNDIDNVQFLIETRRSF